MSHRWVFELDNFRIPSKKNSYQVKFNPTFFNLIRSIVGKFREGIRQRTRGASPYWIGPIKEVTEAEERIAWIAKESIGRDIPGAVELTINAWGRNDADNLLGVICDGLEKSGRIKNDRQVRRIIIDRDFSMDRSGFNVIIKEL